LKLIADNLWRTFVIICAAVTMWNSLSDRLKDTAISEPS